MGFVSPTSICRFSFLLTCTVAVTWGRSRCSRSNTDSPLLAGGMNAISTANGPTGGATREARMKIGPGDLIEVNVYDETDLHQIVRLNDLGDGTLSFIGSVHLAGMTTGQAEALISSKLREGNYLLAPQVGIIIREYKTQGVSVLGEVKTPGSLRSGGWPDFAGCPRCRRGTNTAGRGRNHDPTRRRRHPPLRSFYRKTPTIRFRPTSGFIPETRSSFRAPVWCMCWGMLAGQAGLSWRMTGKSPYCKRSPWRRNHSYFQHEWFEASPQRTFRLQGHSYRAE